MSQRHCNSSCISPSLGGACSANLLQGQHDSIHKGKISWKDLQQEMRSSGMTTNIAAIEFARGRLSNKHATDTKESDSEIISNILLAHVDSDVSEEKDSDLRHPTKTKSLTWQDKTAFMIGLFGLEDEKNRKKQPKRGLSRSGTLSGDELHELLHASFNLDEEDALFDSAGSFASPPANTGRPVELREVPHKGLRQRTTTARSA
eukprot:CAMPEP_0185732042 /NCGR_PEP_ID=MMETSP1171-20130828/14774_1 /TAXON_ID=374046 /ORGANISM="Helicotheca tamensis, Strain CCMP826" /LENGTH=203 /DNA_ID=CAMNT_0028401427 /DNA_START=68 /DNA_END=679 /DNA_ORIENTATION=-